MLLTLRPLEMDDAQALVDAEDEATVRWFSGGRSTLEGTQDYIERLARDAEAGASKRAFGIWLDGACVGTIDFNTDLADDGLVPGRDVNLAYGVAPWVRGRGVAVEAVVQIVALLRQRGVGDQAVIRVDADNPASIRVAEKAGFSHLRDVSDPHELAEDGQPAVRHVYGRPIS